MVTVQGHSLRSEQAPAAGVLPVLIALVLGAEERSRVADAIRHRAQVAFVERVGELTSRLATEVCPIIAVIVEPTDRDQRSVADTVQTLRARLPQLPVVGYCRIGLEHSSGIRALAAAGAHELMFHGVDDRGVALRSVLAAGAQACTAEQVLAQLVPLVPKCLHAFVSFCVRFPQKAHSVAEVASALGLNRKTFVNYSTRTQMLAPAELLAWCRLLLASHYLATTTMTVEHIAMQLDFPSDTALRNMMKRYTALRAQEVRARGGLPCLLSIMRAAIAAHRSHTTSVLTR
jgi:AraC-like DNA-binding protein